MNFKKDEELARMNRIFDEIEAKEHGEKQSEVRSQAEINEDKRKSKESRLEAENAKQIASNAKYMLDTGAFKTKWEKVLAKTLIGVMSKEKGVFVDSKEMGCKNAELNLLRNFASAVAQRLENAERSAKEQDNHHYYKIFAEGVKSLLEKL